MGRLREQGKVRYLGVCNVGLDDLSQIGPEPRPVSNQQPYSLLWRMIVGELNQLTEPLKIALGANPDMWQGTPHSRFR
jgi:aryl-alcohol dehydrogenase-like predicted oxidoreductase